MKKTIFVTFIALTSLMSCNPEEKNSHKSELHEEHDDKGMVTLNADQCKAINLKLGTLQMRNLTTVVKTNGQLEVPPSGNADITTIIGGNVKEIKVFYGDKVKKGEVLAILEHPDYITLQENFAEIANKLEFLEKEYKRQKEMFEKNVGAGKNFQKAKADYNTAKARYEGLKSRLLMLNLSPENVKQGKISNMVKILSPINGYVNEINIKVGTFAGAKDKMFEITDNSAIHADFMIYEKDVHLVKEGQEINFTVSNRPEEELTATVFAVGKEFDPNIRAVHIHAKINEKTTGLIPGMYISGSLHIDEKETTALPDEAIINEGTKSFIFILDNTVSNESGHIDDNHDKEDNHQNEDNKAFRMVEVIPGISDDGFTEVHFMNPLPKNTQIVMNAAYYLLADLKKEETEHEH